jgi:hypothetical protein
MKPPMTPPLIFQVVQNEGAWLVEHEGVLSDRTIYKAEAMASATKLARASSLGGKPAQVRIEGETGYF